jgi:predicted 2-oxoglutarate/Fe(II)-dependent dioxygenase YbiX
MPSIEYTQDTSNLVFDEIYPNVLVYRNMLVDPKKAAEIMAKSEAEGDGKYFLKQWTKWAEFGTYTQIKWGDELNYADKSQQYEDEKALFEEINKAYNKAISHYKNHTGLEIPSDAYFSGHSYCKYFDEIDDLKNNMTMQYHTDYIISQRDMPGPKFHTTCTFYINDNYDGGDLEFYIDNNIINHKPKAGDLVVFPSTDPYYHGVKRISNGNKYFVRNFVMSVYEGSKEWLQNQKNEGAYRWSKKEWERIEKEDNENMIYLSNGSKITWDDAQRIRAEKLGIKYEKE